MKKYKWFIVGLIALLLATAIVLNVSAKSANSMSSECAEDGSCCEDESTCSCN
jgi:bacteriorhodopsin